MSLDRDFLKFDGAPSGYERGRVRVTINDKGQIYLNRKAHEELGKPQAVNLYYSPARQVIAVEPANPRVGAPFPLKDRDHGGRTINAQRMLRHHRIVIDGPEVFAHPEIGNDGILLLDLHDTNRTGGWVAAKRSGSREGETESGGDGLHHPALPGTPRSGLAKRGQCLGRPKTDQGGESKSEGPLLNSRKSRGELRESREEKRERRLLEQAHKAEARERESKARQRRLEIDKKNAAKLIRRTNAIAARKESKDRLAAPKERHRSAGF